MENLTEDPRLTAINNALTQILNSEELKQRWWSSPNRAFEGKTPKTAYETDPSSVAQYIIRILSQ